MRSAIGTIAGVIIFGLGVGAVLMPSARADEEHDQCHLPACDDGYTLSCSQPVGLFELQPCFDREECGFDYYCDVNFDGFVDVADWDFCAEAADLSARCDDIHHPDFKYCRCNYWSEGGGIPYYSHRHGHGIWIGWGLDEDGACFDLERDECVQHSFPHFAGPRESVQTGGFDYELDDLTDWGRACRFLQ